ncbi:Ribbon-helix-helix protein, copG family [Methylobacterium sp. 174MFSha1.1]|uniref:ribbon-helix-helix domain-containing protein n=1 Tax=Methylobacterium sp. 174MFSha1.1 TaxID=1502749 RepID=UPI0008EE3D18|nr:ribbon-helix-helix domain-containing protein [Methylobacterium sp. 174MFSha1.1]SFV02338.1 Ribbon-helix-helix protein, copG family [Methylobacterium sp. 174MFSha1.1]
MTDPPVTDTSETPSGAGDPGPARDEEAFHIPDDLARGLTEFAAVEQLSRGEAICLVLREYLRAKGYLKGTPAG